MVEGQLGALRDPDHGIYPYSTSSSNLAAFAAVGAGLPPYAIQRIVGVVKAYSSCVGAGPFASEIAGSEADELDAQMIHDFPASVLLDRVKPVIERLPGWLCDISAIREFDKLPVQQNYVLYVEQQIGVRISCISVGPNREQIIKRLILKKD